MNHKQTTTADQRNRFAGGKRRFNALRRLQGEMRRAQLVSWLKLADITARGWQSRLAEQLGVHRSVITRDLEIIRSQSKEESICRKEKQIDRQFLFADLVQRSIHGSNNDEGFHDE